MFTGKEKWPLAGSTCGVCHQEAFRTTDRSTGGVLFFSAFLLGDPLPAARAGIALFPSRGWLPASVTQGIIHHFTQAVWCLGSAGGGGGNKAGVPVQGGREDHGEACGQRSARQPYREPPGTTGLRDEWSADVGSAGPGSSHTD